jgi:SAM-dependent methyltransferase
MNFEEMHRLVGSPAFDLPLEDWQELYDSTLEFQPDLVLELGRGYGNSTCVFTEAAQSIPCRVTSIGFDSEHAWESRTAPRLLRVVGEDWFTPLTIVQDDITTVDFRPHLAGSTRTLVYWDAHGTDIADAVFKRLLPALPPENRIIVDDVWPAPEQYGQRAEFRAGPMWSLFDEILPLWDYLSEREIEFASGSRSIAFSVPVGGRGVIGRVRRQLRRRARR